MQHANRNVDLSFLGNRLSNIPLQFISYVLICVCESMGLYECRCGHNNLNIDGIP